MTPEALPGRRAWLWVALASLLVVAALGALWGMGLGGGQGETGPDADATTGTDATAAPTPVEEPQPEQPEPELVQIPDITSMREDEAVAVLERAGFSSEALPSQFSSEVRKGIVLEQTPSGEVDAPKGSVVTYVVSLGADPDANDKGKRGGKPKDDDD